MSTEDFECEDVEVKQEVPDTDSVEYEMLPSGSESGADSNHGDTMKSDMLPSGSESGEDSDHADTMTSDILPSGSECGAAEELKGNQGHQHEVELLTNHYIKILQTIIYAII